MNIDFLAVLTFVVVTSFTPGPNNISSASMGILYGYKRTLPYLFGIVAGFFVVMLLCGWISSTIMLLLPSFENILRIVGAGYILWLAYHTFKATYTFSEDEQALFGFKKGFFLQLVNPKAIIYGLTLYSTFLSSISTNPVYIFISAICLACIGFGAISTWALFGATIRSSLHQPRVTQLFNSALALLLVYTAIELSGVLSLIA